VGKDNIELLTQIHRCEMMGHKKYWNNLVALQMNWITKDEIKIKILGD
jgi:hypothetical protein